MSSSMMRHAFYNHGQGVWGCKEFDLQKRVVRFTKGGWETLSIAEDKMWDDEMCGEWTEWVPM